MDDPNVIVQAAIAGQGVALGLDVLLADEFAGGRLVAPFGKSLATEFSYYLVYPRHALQISKVNAFYTWILDELAEYPIDA